MDKNKKLRVPIVFDTVTKKEYKAEDILEVSSTRDNHIVRYNEQVTKQNRFICAECKQPVARRGGGNSKVSMHFYHLKSEENCRFSEETITRYEIAKNKYTSNEGDTHSILKGKLAYFLEVNSANNKGIKGDICVEKHFKSLCGDAKQYRRPDLTVDFKSHKLAIELQISTLSISDIVGRDMFYKKNEAYILWVFNSFEKEVSETSFTKKDILYNHNCNIFVFDNKCIIESEKRRDLVLRCNYIKPTLTI